MAASTTIRPLHYDDIYNGLIGYLKLVKLSSCNKINFNFKFLDRITGDIEQWKEYIIDIMGFCREIGVTVPVSHAYYSNSFILNDDNDLQKQKIKKCIELSNLIGAEIIVVHAGIYLNEKNEYDVYKTIEENVNYFLPLCMIAKGLNVKIAIENNVVHNQSKVGDIVEPNVNVLDSVCNIINSKLGYKVIGICYDIGHANLANRDILKEIENVKDNLLAMHLHNNNGYVDNANIWKCDTHSPLLEGNIDIYSLLTLLKRIDCNVELIVESVYLGEGKNIIEYINKDTDILNELIM